MNQQDGWTILGWYHCGEVTDASATAESGSGKIPSLNKPIHLAVLFPSNYNDIKDEITAKWFTPTTGVAVSNMAPARTAQPRTTTNMPAHSSQQQSTTTSTQAPLAMAQAPTVPVEFSSCINPSSNCGCTESCETPNPSEIVNKYTSLSSTSNYVD